MTKSSGPTAADFPDGQSSTPVPLVGALLLADLPGRLDELEWEAFLPGIDRHWLYSVSADGPAAALLRFEPGAAVPLHEHRGYEHIFVLKGSQTDENGTAAVGSLLVHAPGTRHRVASKEGCVVLAIYEKPVKFLEKIYEKS